MTFDLHVPDSSHSVRRWQLLRRLTRAAEWPGDKPGRHSQRVGRLAGRLAAEVGLQTVDALMIGAAARFHDVGNIAIAPELLYSAEPLSPQAVLVVRRHVELGAELLEADTSPLMRLARQIALTHHERWDGQGYPGGVRGDDIHIAGRIVAVADAWDVMTHDRPFRRARPAAAALEEIRMHAGTQFDPTVVDALLRIAADGTPRPSQSAITALARLVRRRA